MGEINLGYIKSGMVLASDLKDANGRFLLGKGAKIEDKHIRIMKMWGITSADIEGADQEDIARETMKTIDPVMLEKVQNYVNAFFSGAEADREHEMIRELKQLRVLRLVRRIEAGSESLPRMKAGLEKILHVEDPGPPPKETILPVEQLVEKTVQLSSFPDVYHRIVRMLNDSKSSATKLAAVVSSDPGLSATLLKLVNSAFYGLPSRVSSITRAIALIGGKELSTLALGISVIRFFKDIPPHLINMKNFWLHAVASGVFARIMAHRKVEFSEEEFFIGGLLHDIGRLVLFSAFPATAAYTIEASQFKRLPLARVEQEIMGYNHAKVAGALLEKWNFPKNLREMIKYHHQPLTAPQPVPPAIIYIADLIATALQFGYSGNVYVPPFTGKIWDSIELPTSVLEPSLKQADRQVNEILRSFNLDEEQ